MPRYICNRAAGFLALGHHYAFGDVVPPEAVRPSAIEIGWVRVESSPAEQQRGRTQSAENRRRSHKGNAGEAHALALRQGQAKGTSAPTPKTRIHGVATARTAKAASARGR